MHMLANPVWHALTGPQDNVAERHGPAVRYDPSISPFAALPDEPDREAWRSLAALVGDGGTTVLFREEMPPLPPGWHDELHVPCFQMVAADFDVSVDADAETVQRLTVDDVADMLALVEETRPGPFTSRTHELGTYLGVRENGRLVAMAGERMRPPGYTEISAVCTAETHRGRGMAGVVMRAVATGIVERGDIPILGVITENTPAIRLYEKLGFEVSRPIDVATIRAPRTS